MVTADYDDYPHACAFQYEDEPMPAPKESLSSPLASGWWTSEFGAMLVTIAANVIGILVMFKVVPPEHQQDWTDKLTAIIGLLGIVFGNTAAGAKFMHGRQKIKEKALDRLGTAAIDPQKLIPPVPPEPTRLRGGAPGWANPSQ